MKISDREIRLASPLIRLRCLHEAQNETSFRHEKVLLIVLLIAGVMK